MEWQPISTAPKNGLMLVPVYLDQSKAVKVERNSRGFWHYTILGKVKLPWDVHWWMPLRQEDTAACAAHENPGKAEVAA